MRALLKPNASVASQALLAAAAGWVVVLVLLWGALRPAMLPGPVDVLAGLGRLWSRGVLTEELLHSFLTNLKAIVLSALISLSLAYATVVPGLRFPVEMAGKFRFLGLTGLTLPFTLLFGGGETLKVAILTFAMTATFVTAMSDVVASIRQEQYDHARTLGMGPWHAVWEVVILGKADAAIEVLRQSAATGWMLLTMVEVISQSGGGIGLVLYKANRQYDLLPQVFAILLVILAVGWAQDRAITWIGRTLFPYATLKLERR